jgi:AraC-like DNA-binding protein
MRSLMSFVGPQTSIEKPLTYSEFPVPPEIADVVQCGWSFVARDDLLGSYAHHVLPDGCISLLFRVMGPPLGGLLIVAGPRVRELRVDIQPKDRFWGIRFWPDTGGAVLGIDPSKLRERSDLLAQHAPQFSQSLSASLSGCGDFPSVFAAFCEFCSNRKAESLPQDDAVRRAVISIQKSDGMEPIARVAAAVDLSPRQLQRRFRARVGLTPKEYARIRRMRVALLNALQEEPKGWASVAIDSGYADQAHLSRDVAALTGLSPAGFEARIRPIEHQNFEP